MRRTHLIAAVVVSLSCGLLSASCAQDPNADTETAAPAAQPEPTAEAQQPAYENVFHFVETLKDDAKDGAGGWQEATARLKFCEWRSTLLPICWQCPIKVGMPMRTAKHGRISHRFAAQITAEVATEVTDSLIYSRPKSGSVILEQEEDRKGARDAQRAQGRERKSPIPCALCEILAPLRSSSSGAPSTRQLFENRER